MRFLQTSSIKKSIISKDLQTNLCALDFESPLSLFFVFPSNHFYLEAYHIHQEDKMKKVMILFTE